MKAGNTLDALITDNGKRVVRHYLQDVGPRVRHRRHRSPRLGRRLEYLYQGDLWKRLVTSRLLPAAVADGKA